MIDIQAVWDTTTKGMTLDLGVIQADVHFLPKTNHYSLWMDGALLLNHYEPDAVTATEIIEDKINSLLGSGKMRSNGKL